MAKHETNKQKPMVKKAKYIGKYVEKGYQGVPVVTMIYEYRGRQYEVEDNKWIWNPTWEQHKRAQREIDEAIEQQKQKANEPKKEHKYEDTAEYAFDKFMEYCETGEWTE